MTYRLNLALPLNTVEGDKAVFYGSVAIGWGIFLIVAINIWLFNFLK